MYERILVPLDGSKLAECALTHLEGIAKCCEPEEITLVSVTERVRLPLETGPSMLSLGEYGQYPVQADTFVGVRPEHYSEARPPLPKQLNPNYFGKKEKQAQRYLDRIAKRLKAKGLEPKTAVLIGKPAEEITNYALYHECDLIIIASHGRSGISRWTHGSVADKVFRSSCVPILMVKAPGCETKIA